MRRRLASLLTLLLVVASAHAQEPDAARLNVVFTDDKGLAPDLGASRQAGREG